MLQKQTSERALQFFARAIIRTMKAVKAALILLCAALIVLIPFVLLVASYFDPFPRAILLVLAIEICVIHLIDGIHEWAKRHA